MLIHIIYICVAILILEQMLDQIIMEAILNRIQMLIFRFKDLIVTKQLIHLVYSYCHYAKNQKYLSWMAGFLLIKILEG